MATQTTPHRKTMSDRLREVAALLDAYPDLNLKSKAAYLYIDAQERGDLELLAAALGERAREEIGHSARSVEITGRFGEGPYLVVTGSLSIEKLGGTRPSVPAYERILRAPEAQA